MKKLRLNYIIRSFFSTYWLRFESVPWEVSLYQKNRYLFKNIIKKKSLEIGCGNGITSFINLDNRINPEIDHFSFVNLNQLKNNKKDFYDQFKINKNIKVKKAINKFSKVIDLKKNLLKIARFMNIADSYKVWDCNKILHLNDKFDCIYSTIIYWLKDSPINNLKKWSKFLNKKGLIGFTAPNKNFIEICKTYSSNEKIYKILNYERKKHIKHIIDPLEFEKKIKKQGIFKIIKVDYFLKESTLRFWDIGLRTVSKLLIKSIRCLKFNKMMKLKKNFLKDHFSLIKELCKIELKNDNIKSGGFCFYILKKI
jgi:2-polyprenyl-3-methyl-5-hydroxy-6-metoxy-1,4-benzoquinol methylase